MIQHRSWPVSVLTAWMVCVGLSGCVTQRLNADGTPQARTEPSEAVPAERRARVRLELASAYFSRGQLDTALQEVTLALAADPNMGPAHNLRGLVHAGLGDAAQAEEAFRRALQINARDGDAMHNFGWFLCQQRRFAEADPWFAQALNLPQYPGTVRTLLARGVCQARAGDWSAAQGTLTRAYELDPANAVTAVNLSEVLFRRGDYERARFYIRRVHTQQGQSDAQTLWLAARIEMKMGNRQGANELGRELRDRFPQSAEYAAFERGQFDD